MLADLRRAFILLEGYEPDVRQFGEAFKLRQRHGLSNLLARDIAVPSDPDLELMLADDISPLFDALSFGEKIGHIARYGLDGGLESERQAHQRAMIVKVRQRVAIIDKLDFASEARYESPKRSLRHEQYARVHFLKEWNEPTKLDRVSEPLFPVHQESFVRNICVTQPDWLVDPAHMGRDDLLTPLHLGPAAVVVALEQLEQASVAVCLGIIGLECNRPVIACKRLVDAADFRQSDSASEMIFGIVWVDRNCPLRALDSVLRTIQFGQ